MRSIAQALEKRRAALKKTIFADKDAVLSCIAGFLPVPAPLSVQFKDGTITVRAAAAVRSELFAKKGRVLAALNEKFPHLKITDVR